MSDDPRPTDEAAERSPRSQGVAWMLGLVGVPVVYVLTLPPLMLGVMNASGMGLTLPPWLRVYAAPADWVYEHTPLHDPMEAYAEWWVAILSPSPPLVP